MIGVCGLEADAIGCRDCSGINPRADGVGGC